MIIYSFLNLYFAPPTVNWNAASTQRPYCRESYASTIKYYAKTVVLWPNTVVKHCDRTRTLAGHIYKTSLESWLLRKLLLLRFHRFT